MLTRTIRRSGGATLAAMIVLSIAGPGVAHAQSAAPTVLVSGLNNPRQLSLLRNGQLLIAEAGNGGTTRFGSGKHATYVGDTGSISLVKDPATGSNESPRRILTGFLSAASASGSEATGSDGVSAVARDEIFVPETYAAVTLPPFYSDQLGQLFVSHKRSVPTEVANISAFNQSADPDGQPFDSNPYAVLVTGKGTELVADAAANDIVSVTNGVPTLFHVFPNITTGSCAKKSDPNPSFPGCNFVPTALARNHAGDVFVTGLGSLVPGAGEVVELDSTGTTVLRTWTGFSAPDGIAVNRAGDIYVSQLLAPEANPPSPQIEGVVTEILPSGTEGNTDVPFPAGLAVDGAGNLYISAFSIAPSTGLGAPDTSGEVVRISSDTTS